MLYEIAILEKPTREQAKAGAIERLVFGPVAVVASDDRGAAMSAVIDNAQIFSDIARDRMEVLVRPFVG